MADAQQVAHVQPCDADRPLGDHRAPLALGILVLSLCCRVPPAKCLASAPSGGSPAVARRRTSAPQQQTGSAIRKGARPTKSSQLP